MSKTYDIPQTYEERRAAEKKKEEETNAKLRAIVKALGFKVNEYTERSLNCIECSKGEQVLSLYVQTWGAKAYGYVTVSGIYPRDAKGAHVYQRDNEKVSAINISMNKKSEVIANEIKSRYLPGYLNALEFVKAEIAQVSNYINAREEAIKQLANILDVAYTSELKTKKNQFSKPEKACISQWYGQDFSVESMKIDTDYQAKTVKIEVDCSMAAAKDICQALAPFLRKKVKK